VVIFTSMVRDANGQSHVNPQVAKEIAETSGAPVYGFLDTYIGQGIVGGTVADFAAQGRAAAQLALRVLNGEAAEAIAPQPSPPARCVVDERALERFEISEGLLPPACEVRHRTPSLWRDYRWHALGASALILLQGALVGALLFQSRRRREAEREEQRRRAELAQASRLALVGELTASIAHEINQPLTSILLNIESARLALQQQPIPIEELGLIHADIRSGGTRAAEVIRRIRGLLRREVERTACDINGLVVDVVGLLRAESARRGLRLVPRLASRLPTIECDSVQVQQALLNLIINAMDAMVETPADLREIVVETALTSGAIEVSVIDRGHGIDSTQLPRLFESFFTTKPHGMGLGLSITHSVIEAHDGRIWAESNPAGGATFRFELPLPTALSQTEATADDQRDGAHHRRR
jgi:signal transduction histidine kinase